MTAKRKMTVFKPYSTFVYARLFDNFKKNGQVTSSMELFSNTSKLGFVLRISTIFLSIEHSFIYQPRPGSFL